MGQTDIILSIIIPSYNMEMYLDRCLSSLIVDNSLMNEFEVLIINDGSKDRTSEVAHRFCSNYPETFKVFDKENGHYGSCVNRGLAEAEGDFIKLLDADDVFDTGVFARFLLFLKESTHSNADVILSDSSRVNENNKERYNVQFSKHKGPYTVKDLTDSDKFFWSMPGLTYKTSFLREISYRQTEGIAYTDNEWAFVPMAFAKIILHFDGILYLYMLGRENQSVNNAVHAKNLWMEAEVLVHILKYLDQQKKRIDQENSVFLSDKLLISVTHLYQLYLVTYNHFNISLLPLTRFDQELKVLSPRLYAQTEQYATKICGITFYPVKNWRHQHRFLAEIQAILYCFADGFNKFRSRR